MSAKLKAMPFACKNYGYNLIACHRVGYYFQREDGGFTPSISAIVTLMGADERNQRLKKEARHQRWWQALKSRQ